MNNLISEYNSRELLGGMRLFLYEKKIGYLSRYQNGEKQKGAGFVKILREENAYTLDIHIQSDLKGLNGNYIVLLLLGNAEIAWEKISLREGKGSMRRKVLLENKMLRVGEDLYREEDLYGIKLVLDGQSWIGGNFREKRKEIAAAMIKEKEETVNEIRHEVDEKIFEDRPQPIQFKGCPYVQEKIEQPAFEDKWEQLQHNYQTVHPFDDQRVFLSIEPRDFVVLQAPFQKLVNNSFLLHGFYNYRHLILGPDRELGDEGKTSFYLGVPGTYFDREKMVAVMFGFEGFECAGAVEAGKFGYYMRRVEL